MQIVRKEDRRHALGRRWLVDQVRAAPHDLTHALRPDQYAVPLLTTSRVLVGRVRNVEHEGTPGLVE